jgi:hypothetical protein
MATGAGLSGILTAVLPLVGLVTVWSARRKRIKGIETPQDADFVRRQAEQAESERRMRAYLASRDQRSWRDDDA